MSTTLDPKDQPDMFGEAPADAQIVRPAVPPAELLQVARRLPKNLHLGTSSLSFPGWAGIVYAEQYRVSVLARYGLRAYAKHPLLNALNIDSTFYRPQTAEQLARLAADVPETFRFVVKAYTGLTTEPDSPRAQQRGIEPVFLPSHQFVGSRSVEEQLEYFYAQYAKRVAPLYSRQG